MSKLKIALEGGIFGLTDDDCINWRDYVIEKLGDKFEFHNPMDFDCRGKTVELEQELVDYDEAGMQSSDVLLVNASTGGWGTAMAVQMAFDRNTPVLTVHPEEKISPWLNNRSTVVFKTLDEAIADLREW